MSYWCHNSGFRPGVQICQQIWTPSSQIWTPHQTFLLASFISYLVSNSIWKLFVDVLFIHNTTFLSKDKDKQPFRSNFAAASRTVYARIKCEETTAFELLKLLQFSRRDQNAWDLRKFCAYKRDNAVWNYFRTHFQDNLVHFFVLFGVFGKIYRFIYAGFPKGNNRWQAPDPRF